MRLAIVEKDDLSISQFDAIGGFVKAPIEVRQIKDSSERWRSYPLMLTDDEFLSATGYDFKIFADGYTNKDEVWAALRADPSLAVVDSSVIDGGSDGGPRNRDNDGDMDSGGRLRIKDISIDSESFPPVQIEIVEPVSKTMIKLEIIGILDSATDVMGIVASKKGLDNALGSSIPMTRYRFRVAEGTDIEKVGKHLESSFLGNGMEVDLLEESLLATVSFISSFYNLLTGYMGLGLVVGIAAMGVISMRAVVERRQQIGVLRAIGYRKSMIKLTFVIESSFVALLGVAIGVALGSIISFNLVEGLGNEIEGVRFTVPWLKIVLIVGLVYVSTILTTLLPAGQAANTLPAEALRYE
jgi:putative ABC transport system permease protein